MSERLKQTKAVIKEVTQAVGGIQIVTWEDNGKSYALTRLETDGFKKDDNIKVKFNGLRIVGFSHDTPIN